MKKRHFGFLEMIGSIVLLLFDPERFNPKKYLAPKYLKANRIAGSIVVLVLIVSMGYVVFIYF